MTDKSHIDNLERFRAALARFDEENSQDPNVEDTSGVRQPRELLYAKRLTDWVHRLSPNASEALLLAARCQHLRRWEIPRDSYPATRAGYLNWRSALKQFHAERSATILRAVGYPEATVRQVQDLNLKANFPKDPDCQILEDALCLVFLEHQLGPLVAKTDDEKVIGAIRKSWQKMSKVARSLAETVQLGNRERELVARAIKSLPGDGV